MTTPFFELYDWCFVTVVRHHSTFRMLDLLQLAVGDDIRDGEVGGVVETRMEQNREMPGVCWQADLTGLCFLLWQDLTESKTLPAHRWLQCLH